MNLVRYFALIKPDGPNADRLRRIFLTHRVELASPETCLVRVGPRSAHCYRARLDQLAAGDHRELARRIAALHGIAFFAALVDLEVHGAVIPRSDVAEIIERADPELVRATKGVPHGQG